MDVRNIVAYTERSSDRENLTYGLGIVIGKMYALSGLELRLTWLKNMELKRFYLSLLSNLFTIISITVNVSKTRQKKFWKLLGRKVHCVVLRI